jgi:MT0933-like antitoxin protein
MSEEKSMLDRAQEIAKDVAVMAKDVALAAKEKVSTYLGEHEEQIHSGIDKTGGYVDEKTKGRYSEKIDKAQEAVKGAVTRIGASEGENGGTATGGSTSGAEASGSTAGSASPGSGGTTSSGSGTGGSSSGGATSGSGGTTSSGGSASPTDQE